MSDLLNPDQIAALFEAAKQGTVPETPADRHAAWPPAAHGRLLTADEVHQ